ncbi:MAG TPA: hypothetical protein VK253_08610 [Candidatus Binatia bacterium]|nr:hypothetical protein [Candidatus Binatia bacterium]
MRPKSLFWLALIAVFLLLPLFMNNVSAQTQSNYYVTIKPATIPNALTYTSIDRNATLSFVAIWTYGSNEGQKILNATATIQVTNSKNKVIETVSVNTTSGIFSFNYTSSTADVLAFTPTKLVTQDGQEWNSKAIDVANNVYGFTSDWAQVWYDTFHVSLVSHSTSELGSVAVSVNVTYLLLPEDGLQVGVVQVPKTVQEAEVTINSVKAKETQTPGVYSADSSTLLPTAYVNVKVSRVGWTTTDTAFSFTQNANAAIWIYAVGFGSVLVFVILILRVYTSKKTKNPSLFRHANYPFSGAVLLVVTSIISLYWGLVGLEGTLYSFDWAFLAVLGLVSFALGIASSIMVLRKKQQALAIFAVIMPLFTNVVGIKSSLDMYGLGAPWLIIIPSLLLSLLSGFLISNSDKIFQNGIK